MTLFAYGTLLVPEIWLEVTRRADCPSQEAILPGYAIRRVKGADYPGIVLGSEADEVAGRILSGLDTETFRFLNGYEGSQYHLVPVLARKSGGGTVRTQAYVISGRNRSILSDEGWTLEWFREHAMARFMEGHF